MAARKTPAVLTGITLAAVGLLFVFDPAVTAWFPSCPLNALTGWLCPFCGSLRAAHALLRGNLVAALHFNAMTTAGMVGGVAALSYDAVRPGQAALVRLASLCTSPQGLALAATFGLLRNFIE